MANATPHYGCSERWEQVSAAKAAQLVRIVEHQDDNYYSARPIAFDAQGATEPSGADDVTVVNLAEMPEEGGKLPPDVEAIALDTGGRWVIFVRPPSPLMMIAKVISSLGDASYSIREQVATGAGTFADASGVADVTAYNLAELSLGPGSAVDTGSIVTVRGITDNGDPPVMRYVFDHPAYAKYLD